MGRPQLPRSARKTRVVGLRLTEQEEKHLTEKYGKPVTGLRILLKHDMKEGPVLKNGKP